MTASPSPLLVLHRSDHFLVLSKPFDLVINSDDPERDSLYKRMREQFPELADDKFKVRNGTPRVVGTKAKFLAVGAWGLEGLHWPVGLGLCLRPNATPPWPQTPPLGALK